MHIHFSYPEALMKKDEKFLSIIPARYHSKRLPNKNLMLLEKKPLLQHTIESAYQSQFLKNHILTTDIPKELVKDFLPHDCLFHQRSSELAMDQALISDVVINVIHFFCQIRGFQPEYIILLQPTSPLRTSHHIDAACKEILNNPDFPSLMSVVEPAAHPYKMFTVTNNSMSPLRDISDLEKPKQLLPKIYAQNGAIYIVKTNEFLKSKSFYIAPSLPYLMSADSSIDIDTAEDFLMAKFFLQNQL